MVFLAGCRPPPGDRQKPPGAGDTYKIVLTRTGLAAQPESTSYNTILFNTRTGESWLLWPTADRPAGYSWLALAQRTDKPGQTVPAASMMPGARAAPAATP